MALRNNITACMRWVRATSVRKLRLMVVGGSTLFWLVIVGVGVFWF